MEPPSAWGFTVGTTSAPAPLATYYAANTVQNVAKEVWGEKEANHGT